MGIKRIKYSSRRLNEIIAGYLFIAPMAIGLGIFSGYAFFQNIYFSFNKVGAFGKPKFIGLENYINAFTDPDFFLALKNTFFYTIFGVPLVIIFSVIIAHLLNKKIKGRTFYRVCIFVPAITMPAAIGILWRWLLNYKFGIVNYLLEKVGITSVAWLSEPKTVKWAILIALVWSMVSYYVIIMLGGMQSIDPSYYEAAIVDGAGPVQLFFKVTIPLLTPIIFFSTIMSAIGILQIFDFIFLMIQRNSIAYQYSISVVTYFYELAFVKNLRGYASAISIILCSIIMIFTSAQLYFQKYWVNYDN
ncbi:carbohydrate ABC transporter permease [Clostridium swellfunianum]|uniref:carbohydrate ABC transporter permease n=1 Tax=Clostridium swellfunianum TaxID=1367462 RepID=UPI00202F2FF7|nr:sugar ABC transporter permease [Clostridium swellfunianum]